VTGRQADLEALIEEITVDCYGEEEELTGFLTYLEDALERRDGSDYEVSLLDVVLPRGSELARVLAAYRYWAGVDPWLAGATRPRGAGGGAAARR
jgi:hypothetical protein